MSTPKLEQRAMKYAENTDGEFEYAKDWSEVSEIWLAGYAAAIEDAAKVATSHALDHGPTHDFTMGGHKISEKIRALASGKKGE